MSSDAAPTAWARRQCCFTAIAPMSTPQIGHGTWPCCGSRRRSFIVTGASFGLFAAIHGAVEFLSLPFTVTGIAVITGFFAGTGCGVGIGVGNGTAEAGATVWTALRCAFRPSAVLKRLSQIV